MLIRDALRAVETISRVHRVAEGRRLTNAQASDVATAEARLRETWRHVPVRFGDLADYRSPDDWTRLHRELSAAVREQEDAPMSNHPHAERLRLERSELVEKMKTVLGAAERENRDLTPDEDTRWKALDAEVSELDARIARVNADEARARAADVYRREAGIVGVPSSTSLTRALFGDITERRDMFAYSTGGTAVVRTEYASTIWEHLAGQSVVLNLPGITRYTTTESTFSLTGGTSFVTAAAVSEGGTATPADPGYVRNVITPAKYVAFMKASDEFWSDSGEAFRTQIANNLVRSLALEISKDMLEGAGSPGIEGIASLSGVGTVDANGGTATNLSYFAQAMGTALAANATPTSWVMAPEMYGALIALTEGTASNRPLLAPAANAGGAPVMTLFGIPITVAPAGAISGGTSVYLLSAPEIVTVTRADFAISINPFLEFDQGLIGIKAVARIGMTVPNPASQVVIENLAFA